MSSGRDNADKTSNFKKVERPKGTRDFLPEEMEKRRELERIMRKIAESYGYREISTPTFEHLELFTIKSGEGIIEEIYAFKDKGNRDLALRPELTAPVMRMFVNECSVMPRPLRFYYFSNCFRYENPQKGRYREFWQFGVELIGSDSYLSDVEVILLAYRILKELGISFELNIGHVGLLRTLLQDLSDEKTQKIMRLIDKKDFDGLRKFLEDFGLTDYYDDIKAIISMKGGREVIDKAQEIIPNFNFEYIDRVAMTLEELGLDFNLDFSIVRGLDYYTGVVFEFYALEGLGAQNQICGGGSYRLTHLFGGRDVPSTGFAIGFDRVAEICPIKSREHDKVVIASTPGMEINALKIAEDLRGKGIKAYTDVMGRGLKKQLSFANTVNARFAIIVAEKEYEKGVILVKDLKSGEQKEVPKSSILDYLGL